MSGLDAQIFALAKHYAKHVWPSTLRPDESLIVVVSRDGERAHHLDRVGAVSPLSDEEPSGQTFDLGPYQSIVVHIGTPLIGSGPQVAYVVRAGDPRELAGMRWHEVGEH